MGKAAATAARHATFVTAEYLPGDRPVLILSVGTRLTRLNVATLLSIPVVGRTKDSRSRRQLDSLTN